MEKGQLEYAIREALNQLDKWNDCTGVIEKNTGYYYELISVIEDAVHIGIHMATYGKIIKDNDGNIKTEGT